MNLQLFSTDTILNSSTYSKMLIVKDCSIKDNATYFTKLKEDGYTLVYNKAYYGINTSVLCKDGEVVTLSRNSNTGDLRIMWEEEKYNSLEPITKPETVGDGETVLSQIGVGAYGIADDDPMIGMLYVCKNSDGHAIIFDGGIPVDGDANDIFKALESHNIAKDENGKYIIAAWIFTHAHGDHIGAFLKFAPKYSDRTTLKYVMYNFPGDGQVASREGNFAEFEKDIDEFYPEAKRITPRMGQEYYFGNIKAYVLYSPDMLYVPERRLPYFNDTSIVVQLEAEGVKALFLGDGGDLVAKTILEGIGRAATIKSDFVQITHHGLYTSSYLTPHTADEKTIMTRNEKAEWEAERHINKNLTKLYQTAAPSVGLWPMGDTNGQPRNGRTTVMRDWSRTYGQTAYFVDTAAEDSGYDGVNVVRKGDLITYTASSETELMITKFLLKDGTSSLVTNQTWESFLEENKS